MKSFFKRIIAGFFVGIGAIIPGLSGGILAVSMGLYKPCVDAVTGFFHAPKRNFRFLLPLVIGGGAGLVLFMFLLDWLLVDFRTAVICVFLGLVAGSVPSFMRECNANGFKKFYFVFAAIGLIAALALIIPGLNTGEDIAQRAISPFMAALCGGIIMLGVVLPGVSTSFVLMNMGVYEEFLAIFTSPPELFAAARNGGATVWQAIGSACADVPLMLFAVLGMIIIAIPTLLLVKKVIDRFHGPAYYLIFGVLIATMIGCAAQEVVTLANDATYHFTWWRGVIYAALLAGGFVLSLLTERFIHFKEDEQPPVKTTAADDSTLTET